MAKKIKRPRQLTIDVKAAKNGGYGITVRDQEYNEDFYVAKDTKSKDTLLAKLSAGGKPSKESVMVQF